jgi:hypothetical protein
VEVRRLKAPEEAQVALQLQGCKSISFEGDQLAALQAGSDISAGTMLLLVVCIYEIDWFSSSISEIDILLSFYFLYEHS